MTYPSSGYPKPIGSFNYPIPIVDVDPDATPWIQICINPAWVPVILGCLTQLLLQSTWDTSDPEVLAEQQGRVHDLREIIGMATNCCAFRMNGGVPQISHDGGQTWENAPSVNDGSQTYDPRINEPLLPHRTGDNRRCLAAANAVAVFVELHRQVVKWYDDNAIALACLGAIALALGIFFPVSWAVFGLSLSGTVMAIFFLTHTAILNNAAFTSAIQDDLRCILYCNMDADGQVNATSFAHVLDDISNQSGEMWELIHYYVNDIAGITGLNNAGTTTSVATADCQDCTSCTWCYKWDFRASQWGWQSVYVGYGSSFNWTNYTASVGWTDTIAGYPGPSCYAACAFDFDNVAITSVKVGWRNVTPTSSGGVSIFGVGAGRPAAGDSDVEYSVATTLDGLSTVLGIVQDWGHLTIEYIELRGDGNNPFGANNC